MKELQQDYITKKTLLSQHAFLLSLAAIHDLYLYLYCRMYSCEGKASCSLRADRQVFLAIGMCEDVITQLSVQFICRQSQSVNQSINLIFKFIII